MIPKKNLAFEIAFYAYEEDVGAGTFTAVHLSTQTTTLTYSFTGSNFEQQFWTGMITCPDGVSRQVQMICADNDPTLGLGGGGTVALDSPPASQRYSVPPSPTITTWPAHNGFANPPMFNGSIGSNPAVRGSYTCVPFGFINYIDDYSNTLGLSATGAYGKVSDPTTATYTGHCCVTAITVFGCGGANLPGATYTIWNDSTKLSQISSGTTASAGDVSLDAISCGVALYREITHPRLATVSGTTTFNGISKAETGMTTPISGYTCFSGCGAPVANTIHATFSVAGAKTLVNSGSGWTVSFAASTHSYVVTLATNGTLTITRDGVSCGTATWTLGNCPPSFSGTFTVPAGICTTELGSSATVTE